jgi:uncharacterized protein
MERNRHMCLRDNLYRFSELDRELVYNTESVTATSLSEIEARLVESLQDGNPIEESARVVQNEHGYAPDEVERSLERLKRTGLLDGGSGTPLQEISHTYALTLNLTQACNLRCRYCYVEKPASAPAYMSENTARQAVDWILGFSDLEAFGISFYGGEPLLNYPVLKSTIEYASARAQEAGLPEVEYHLTTNGTLLTDEAIAFLRDWRINVMISIDGPASVHDKMRVTAAGEGTHALVLDRLLSLTGASGEHRVSASGVVTNRSSLREAYDYLSQLHVRDVKLSYVRYIEDSAYALTDLDRQQYIDDMTGIARECERLLLQGSRPPYYNFENKILQLWKRSKRRYFCPAGLTRFGISPTGRIYPCGPAAAMGEWKLGTLERGLNSEAMDGWAAATSLELREDCRDCWARHLCAGGCPLRLVRRFDEQRCEINKHSTRLAIAIYAGIKERNEMMLAGLVDEGFLTQMRQLVERATP